MKNAKGEDIWVLDTDNKSNPMTDHDWTLKSKANKFTQVVKPEITNGLIAGDWKQISAEKNSDFGPSVDGLNVPEESLSADGFKNGDEEEYTLYYVVPANHVHYESTVTRKVNFVTENGNQVLDDSTTESVSFEQDYYTDDKGQLCQC